MEITYLDGDNGRVPIQSGMEIVAVAGVPIKGFGNILEITYKVINLFQNFSRKVSHFILLLIKMHRFINYV